MATAQPYPFYDELVKRMYEHESNDIDVGKMSTTINKITQNSPNHNSHYEMILSLIVHHCLLNNDQPYADEIRHGYQRMAAGVTSSYYVPYEGKVMAGGKGALFDVSKFPSSLQRIIAEYIDLSAQ